MTLRLTTDTTVWTVDASTLAVDATALTIATRRVIQRPPPRNITAAHQRPAIAQADPR